MSSNYFSGDAFSEDRKEVSSHGFPITSSHSTFSHRSLLESSPNLKNNMVSHSSVEDLNPECEKSVSISDPYYIYSVSQKKNKIRIIDSVSGNKIAISAHENFILDMAFSPVSNTIFGSVDNTPNPFSVNIFKKTPDEFSFSSISTLPLPAKLIRPHPLQSSIWAISNENNIALFSSDLKLENITQYSDLPLHYKFDDNLILTNMVFSDDGNCLICSYMLKSFYDDQLKNSSLKSSSSINSYSFIRILSIQGNLSQINNVGSKDCYFSEIYTQNHNQIKIQNLLSISYFNQCIVTLSRNDESTLENSSDEVNYEIKAWSFSPPSPFDNLENEIIPRLLQTIQVALPATKSINEKASNPNPHKEAFLCIEHRKKRVLFLVSRISSYAIALGVHPSAIAGMKTIKGFPLYHITLINMVSPVISFDMIVGAKKDSHGVEEKEAVTILCHQLNEKSAINTWEVPLKSLCNFSNYNCTSSLSLSNTIGSTATTPVKLTSDSSSEANSIFNTLKNFNTVTKEDTGTSILSRFLGVNTSSTPLETPLASTIPPPVTGSPKKLTKIDSNLLFKSPTAAAPKPDSSTDILDMLQLNSTPKNNINLLSMLKKQPTKPTEPTSDSPLLEASSSVPPISPPIPSPCITSPPPAPVVAPVTTSAPSPISLTGNDNKDILSLILDLHRKIDNISQPKSVSQTEVKDIVNKELKLHQQKIQDMLKSHQDTQMKNIEKAIGNVIQQQKTVLMNEFIEHMATTITPTHKFTQNITQGLTNRVKDTIKDTVKNNMGESFRNAFESSLLPAFQAGTDRLFAQLNNSFEVGIKSVLLDDELHTGLANKVFEEIEPEINGIKDHIVGLENLVSNLTNYISNGTLETNTAQAEQGETIQTPQELLDQGLVSESLVAALNLKNVDVILSILDQLTPQTVIEKSSNIIRLCITQQLAADMSVTCSSEGLTKRIYWIKSLVLNLVRMPTSEIEKDEKLKNNFIPILSTIMESIKETKKTDRFDNGEDNSVCMSSSVITDLDFLEFVINSKIN